MKSLVIWILLVAAGLSWWNWKHHHIYVPPGYEVVRVHCKRIGPDNVIAYRVEITVRGKTHKFIWNQCPVVGVKDGQII